MTLHIKLGFKSKVTEKNIASEAKPDIAKLIAIIKTDLSPRPESFHCIIDYDTQALQIDFFFPDNSTSEIIESDCRKLVEMFFDENEPVSINFIELNLTTSSLLKFSNKEINSAIECVGLPVELWINIFSMLGVNDLLRVALVCKIFSVISADVTRNLWQPKGPFKTKDEFEAFALTFPKDYQPYFRSLSVSQSIKLHWLVRQPFAERLKSFKDDKSKSENDASPYSSPYGAPRRVEEYMLSNENCILLMLGYLTIANVLDAPALQSIMGIIALKEGILTVRQASEFTHNRQDRTQNFKEKLGLQGLLTEEGLDALRRGLITIDGVKNICGLGKLLTKHGIYMLENGLLSTSQYRDFERNMGKQSMTASVNPLLTPNGIKALEQEWITVEQAQKVPCLDVLLSDLGLYALEHKLITPNEAGEFYHDGRGGHCSHLGKLICENGIKALEQKWITAKQAYKIGNLEDLLSDLGLYALEHKLITPEQAAKFHHTGQGDHCSNLRALICENGIAGLELELFTVEEAYKTPYLANITFNSEYFGYVKEGLFPMEELAGFDHPVAMENHMKSLASERREQRGSPKPGAGVS